MRLTASHLADPRTGGRLPVTEYDFTQAVLMAGRKAARYVRKLQDRRDLDAFYGEARMAVWLAALSYDPTRGWSFFSWAGFAIGKALQEEARRQDWLSRSQRKRFREIERKEGAGEPLTDEDREFRRQALRQRVVQDATQPTNASATCGTGSQPFDHARSGRPIDGVADVVDVEADALRRLEAAEILTTCATLEPLDREIVMLRLWAGMPLVEVAAKLGRSQRTIRQRMFRAIDEIKRCLGETPGREPTCD